MTKEKIIISFTIQKSRTLAQLFQDAFHLMSDHALLLVQTLGRYSFSLLFFSLLTTFVVLDTFPRLENLFYLKDSLSKPGYVLLCLCIVTYIGSFCTLTLIINLMLMLRDGNFSENPALRFAEFNKKFLYHIKTYSFNFFIIYVIYRFIDHHLNYLKELTIFQITET